MSTIFKLEHPIQIHGELVSELELARPKTKLFKNVDLSNFGVKQQMELISKIATVPGSEIPVTFTLIEELDFADFGNIGKLITGWFSESEKQG